MVGGQTMFLQSTGEEQKEAIKHFYDRLSPHFRSLWGPHLHDGYYKTGKETRERAQEQLVEFLAELAEIPRGSRVLDVGCGLGATSVWLAEHLACRPTGVTLSDQQVQMARELAAEHQVEAEFQVMDAEHLEFEETFDAIWMVGVLGHLPCQESFLRSAHRLIRSKGRFLLADWTVGPEVGESDYAALVEPVIKGMLMPTIVPVDSYVQWFEESEFKVGKSVDITEETRKTWEQSVQIVQAPKVFKLATSLGRDALDLLSAVRAMKKAMKRRLVRYSVVVAEKI